eukprot:64323_1
MNCCKLFFATNTMNHCDFLKYITNLGKDDHILAIEMLEHFNADREAIEPFYDNHNDFPRNEVHICEVYRHVRELQRHTVNIYQSWFLDVERWSLAVTSIITLLVQCYILMALITQCIGAPLTQNGEIYGVIVATSIFFIFQCYGTAKSTYEFWQRTEKMDPCKRVVLFLDIFINIIIVMVIPIFNIYFLLTSQSLIDAVLNSTAIFFVIELDDIVAPDWDHTRYMDELAINFHDYIMEPMEYDIEVQKVSDGIDISYDDCYVYCKVSENRVDFHYIQPDLQITQLGYKISGRDAHLLTDNLRRFYCTQRFWDIHD